MAPGNEYVLFISRATPSPSTTMSTDGTCCAGRRAQPLVPVPQQWRTPLVAAPATMGHAERDDLAEAYAVRSGTALRGLRRNVHPSGGLRGARTQGKDNRRGHTERSAVRRLPLEVVRRHDGHPEHH